MANASSKVRAIFTDATKPLTLAEIKGLAVDLKSSEISMALSYLMRQRYLTRDTVPNTSTRGRKQVYVYQYHSERIEQNE